MNAFTNKRKYARKKSLSLIEARTLYTNWCGICKDDSGGDVQWRACQEAKRQRQKKRTNNAS